MSPSNTYVLVWANGVMIYYNSTLISLIPNTEGLLTLLYNYNDGYTAIGYLQANGKSFDIYFPTSYGITYNVINTGGFTDPSGPVLR
ncbi:hypothetical protein [Sulfurisphaera ohwakuensis]|uniref:hypothetical protein n=1 Tax=Sulfurisphaera ohwakuensis TaxID=69656 RepID=UPI0036F323BB